MTKQQEQIMSRAHIKKIIEDLATRTFVMVQHRRQYWVVYIPKEKGLYQGGFRIKSEASDIEFRIVLDEESLTEAFNHSTHKTKDVKCKFVLIDGQEVDSYVMFCNLATLCLSVDIQGIIHQNLINKLREKNKRE